MHGHVAKGTTVNIVKWFERKKELFHARCRNERIELSVMKMVRDFVQQMFLYFLLS